MRTPRKILTALSLNALPAILLSVAVGVVAGCSWFDAGHSFEPFQSPASSSAEVKPAETAPPSEPAPQPEQKSQKAELPQFIEVTWEIPADKVEGYVIRYGTEKDNLESVVRLAPGEVQRVRHEKYGDVFRYLLPNPPRDKTIYVSVAAISAGNESAPSRVFEVGPDPKALAATKSDAPKEAAHPSLPSVPASTPLKPEGAASSSEHPSPKSE